MIKREELSNPNSCMSRASEDEMTFVLLGRDVAAPAAIRAWIEERVRLGKNAREDPQILEAMVCATFIQAQHPLVPKPVANEGLAKKYRESTRLESDGTAEELERCARMLDTYAVELYPANEQGQVHFARAMMESTADVIRAFLAKAAKPQAS